MNPSAPVGFAGDAGRLNDGAAGRGAAEPSWRAAGSCDNAGAAGQSTATNTSGTTVRDDIFMRTVTASSGSSADGRSQG